MGASGAKVELKQLKNTTSCQVEPARGKGGVRFGSKADVCTHRNRLPFSACLLWAKSMQKNRDKRISDTSPSYLEGLFSSSSRTSCDSGASTGVWVLGYRAAQRPIFT